MSEHKDTSGHKETFDAEYPLWIKLVLGLVLVFITLYYKIFYRLKIEKDDFSKIKGPCIILGNHSAMIDFLLMSLIFFPRRIHFVMSDVFLAKWWGPWVFKTFQQIPKSQFFAETQSVRQMKRVIQAGGSIGIYPEGKMSITQRSGYIAPAIGKLVKSFCVPVILVNTQGVSLIGPLWAKRRRWFGRITLKASVVLSQEEVEASSAAEIYEIICQGLSYDDILWQQATENHFYGTALAEQLEGLLHRCPVCDQTHAMVSKGAVFYCRFCGFSTRIDALNRLMIDHLPGEKEKVNPSLTFPTTTSHWYDWQGQRIMEKIVEPGFRYCSKAAISRLAKQDYQAESLGDGCLTLTKEGIELQLPPEHSQESIFFPAGQLPTLTGKLGSYIDLPTASALYRIEFSEVWEAVLWIQATEVLYQLSLTHNRILERAK
jgi:hypothetical protein